MDCLEHDITIDPDTYQPERAARFRVNTVCILKALRRLGIRDKNLQSSKGGSRKKICIVVKA
ncbi:hypothetical protein [Holospora curviuscula]|uniref:Uncharacterized protein n=1 Tax=Holospora curviuscula TaxID=1082868 RepID=A0A2S5RE52_9PROT|nr:hypothetical protein [Holospora curviuscula]PPE05596.1 hypothetical protein HCUR_00244 [Holospora curviuscula]